jgi:hypothetical protein
MRLTSRSLLGIGSVAAIVLTATVGGSALASRGADDATPSPSSTSTPSASPTADDRGGLTDRDQRREAGDDRRLNGSASSASVSPSAVPTATHHAGDDHGRRHGGRSTDGSGHHSGGDDSGHHSGGDDKGGDDKGGDDSGKRHGGHGSDD